MSAEETLFEAARKLTDGAQRNAFLDAACAGKPELRRRVDELLAAQTAADQIFEQAPARSGTAPINQAPVTEGPGTVIGRYKLLERVGEGGFGIVYVAEQREPVKRRVALKIIKLGMDTKEVVARFEAERQALALMDHPNIAKVLDAGATESGRPFFVMELVRGIRITDYCDQSNLPTIERLKLFIQICHAIQHAHQKGIIHRDIKPSNILVTLHDGVPVPKVIDFGIAKATQQELTEKTLYTELQQFVGTPTYMSPEQAEMSGLDIDTRSDIYSLGVLLYELLTGKPPFDGKKLLAAGIDVLRRTIREQEPQRPSTQLKTLGAEELTTTAKRRGIEAPKLITLLRGDLDWIVMKCLEKDRTRRYETANGVAADLKRFLGNEPVVARPPSTAYRFQKLVRRNKGAAFAAAAIVTALLGGLTVSTYAFVRERDARLKQLAAEQARRAETVRADSVVAFVAKLLRETVPTMLHQGNARSARDLLDLSDQLAGAALSNAPSAELGLRTLIASLYADRLQDHSNANRQGSHLIRLLPSVPDDKLSSPREELRTSAAAWRLWSGQVEQARSDLQAMHAEFLGRNPPAKEWAAKCLFHEAVWLFWNNETELAENKLAAAYDLRGTGWQNAGKAPSLVGDWRTELHVIYAQVVCSRGNPARAERVAREGFQPVNGSDPDSFRVRVDLLVALSDALCKQLRFADAESLLLQQERELALADCPPYQLLKVRGLRGTVLARSGDARGALPILAAVATNEWAAPKQWYPAICVALGAGDLKAYRDLCGVGLSRFASGAEGLDALQIASILQAQPQDEPVMRVAGDLISRMEQSQHWVRYFSRDLRAWWHYRAGRYAEADVLLLKPREGLDAPIAARVSKEDTAKPIGRFRLATSYVDIGRREEALKSFAEGLEALGAAPSAEHPRDLGEAYYDWYLALGTRREAEQVFKAKGIPLPP